MRYAKDDDIILVGHEGHERSRRYFGEASNTFKWLEYEVDNLVVRDHRRVVWVADSLS